MRGKHILLTFSALFFLMLSAHGMLEDNFRKIDMQDGLADNSVCSILKDGDGFIWFGTENGLSRYDGKMIRNFLPEFHRNITCLYDTPERMLLFIANNYLFCFDKYRECLVPVNDWNDTGMYYTKGICAINDSLFWSISLSELQLIKRVIKRDKKNNIVYTLELKEKYVLARDEEYLNTICLSPEKSMVYMTTNRCRLLAFNSENSEIEVNRYFEYKEKYTIVPTSLSYHNDCLWISFIGKGVIQYDIRLNSYKQYCNPPHKNTILSHNDVYSFISINNQNFLAATWYGYTIFSPDRTKSQCYTTEIFDRIIYQPYYLEARMISAYYDPQGTVYIGTDGGGVIVSNLMEQFYHKFQQNQNNDICGIIADNQKRIWLATYSGEILRSKYPFDPQKQIEFELLQKSSDNEERAVLCVAKDRNGNLWFGNSNSSISCYDMEKQKFIELSIPVQYRIPGNPEVSVYVRSLFIDKKNHFWLGTNQGLLLFNQETGVFSVPQSDGPVTKITSSIRAIAPGKDNSIWLGTTEGLIKLQLTGDNKFSLKSGFEGQRGISARYVRSLLSSDDGCLYIGYITGLGILHNDTVKEFYSTKDGLCNNFIGCITEDARGNIWLGTNSGISQYSKYQHLFFNYYISGSNKSASLVGKTLFWGNYNTLTYFDPGDIITIPQIQKPVLLDIEVNNKKVLVGEAINGQVILNKALHYTTEIILNYMNRDFSLRFNDLTYYEGLKKYNYRLIPYQEEWLACDEHGKVSYTNLPAGEYTFEVKSISPEETSSTSNTLHITIQPHWSRSWWLQLTVYLIIIVVVVLIVRSLRKKQMTIRYELNLQHELAISNMERNHEKQLREEREGFFIHTAHELRTPLTLVLSPLRGLLSAKKSSDKDYQTLHMILENGNSLQRLVDDLLCVQKIGAGTMKLEISEVDIVSLVNEVTASFRLLAEDRNIDFIPEGIQGRIMLWIDREKMVSAIRNLLSNSFKYTPEKGQIKISISEAETDGVEFCQITVTDNGIGIPHDLQDKVFDFFTTGSADPRFSTKVGIGLYLVKNIMDLHHGTVTLVSEPQKGSAFTLSIPKGNEYFTNDQYEIIPGKTECQAEEKTDTRKTEVEEIFQYSKKSKLLIIEDNPDIRKYIISIFPQKQYTILEAENGQEGVEQAQKEIPDLIITDIMMPVKDGFECSREIRENPEIAHIPIIILTAKAEDADIIRSAQLGVDDYMMKPFNPELLKAKVENILLYRGQLKRLYTKALLLKDGAVNGKKEEPEDTFMQQIINIVEANLTNESFGVKMLAERLNISQPTLYRKIKQRSDLSIIEVIRSVRMSKAAVLLMERRYSIQEISFLVGFADPNTFRKHFTQQFGVPPSKYV